MKLTLLFAIVITIFKDIDAGKWELAKRSSATKAEDQIAFDLTTTVVGKKTIVDVSIESKARNWNPQLFGLSLGLVSPQILCESGAPKPCVELPTSNNKAVWDKYDQPYFQLASNKLLLSFKNPINVEDAAVCQKLELPAVCSTSKSQCDKYNKPAGASDKFPFILDSPKESSLTVKNFEKKEKNEQGNGSLKRTFYYFTFELDNSFFNFKDDNSDNFLLGITDNKKVYMSWGLWFGKNRNEDCLSPESTLLFNNPKGPIEIQLLPKGVLNSENQFVGTFGIEPTQSPTSAPVAPTDAPTKKPTTKNPTKAPTTPRPTRPTKAPVEKPTKKPTTKRPTKAPVEKPTKKPTTKKPTNAPVERPTKPPVETPKCPNLPNWSICQRINGFYNNTKDAEEQYKQQRRACKDNGCHWCGYDKDDLKNSAYKNCRPKKFGTKENHVIVEKNHVCPVDSFKEPYVESGCQMFENCPTPEEMSACKALNFERPGYLGKRCEGHFTTEFKKDGQTYTLTAGKKRCAYNNGICRAVGDYAWAKKLLFQIPGYFGKIRKCPFEVAIPPLPDYRGI